MFLSFQISQQLLKNFLLVLIVLDFILKACSNHAFAPLSSSQIRKIECFCGMALVSRIGLAYYLKVILFALFSSSVCTIAQIYYEQFFGCCIIYMFHDNPGLRIAPPEAPVTGYMFGKGIYFADMFSKSANYCYATNASTSGVLLLCEVVFQISAC